MRRYDRELSLEIDRTVRRFNAKIKRLEKQERELVLPEPIERTDIVTYTSSKDTIQRKLKEYQRFLERGGEEVVTTSAGVKLPKFEYENLRREQKAAKISLTREINKLSKLTIREFGEDQAGTFQSMGDPYLRGLISKRKAIDKNIDELSKDEIKRKVTLFKRVRNNQGYERVFKDNFIVILRKLGYLCGVESWKVDLIIEKLKLLTPPQLNELINRDKGLKSVIDYYIEYFDIMRSRRKSKEQDMNDLINRVEDLYDNLVNNIDQIIEDYV